MIKVRIKKDNKIIFESNSYKSYDNTDFLEFDFYNLSNVDLSNADLNHASLINADLRYAKLSNADLSYACLYNVDLSNADLSNADLSYADLSYAILNHADLKYANLNYANLSCACLYNTDLNEQERIRQGIVLDKSMIGYKKAIIDNISVIVALEIPKNAIVFSINNKKCRTNICKVIDIEGKFNKAYSFHDNKFVYRKGKIIRIKNFNLQYNVECATGIHFFKTKQEALDYNY